MSTPANNRVLTWVHSTATGSPSPSSRTETPVSWPPTTVRGTPAFEQSLQRSIEATPAPTQGTQDTQRTQNRRGAGQKGVPKVKYSEGDLTLVFKIMNSLSEDYGSPTGKWWHNVARRLVSDTVGRLSISGDALSKKMRAIWKQRDLDRQAETGTEKRIDDFTTAADAWIDFVDEYEAQEAEEMKKKKEREDNRAAAELARENLTKTLSQKKSKRALIIESDTEESEDMSYIDNGDNNSVGFPENYMAEEEGAIQVPNSAPGLNRATTVSSVCSKAHSSTDKSKKRPSKRQKIDRQASETALNSVASSILKLVDLRSNEHGDITRLKNDVQRISEEVKELKSEQSLINTLLRQLLEKSNNQVVS